VGRFGGVGFLVGGAVLFTAFSAQAQSGISGGIAASAEYTDNAELAPDNGPPLAKDEVYSIRPSITALSQTQGLDAYLRYRLSYWHYQQTPKLDRTLHDLAAHARLTWWENLEVQVAEDLVPVPLEFGQPLDNPANAVQSTNTSGKIALKHDFDESTHGTIGYEGEHLDYIQVHSGDTHPPAATIHGPGVGVVRDLDHVADLGLEYRYRMLHWTGSSAQTPAIGDVDTHSIALRPHYYPIEGLDLSAAIGEQFASFENGDKKTRTLVDAVVVMDRTLERPGRLRASYLQHLTQDITGNPADEKVGVIDGEYDATSRIALGAGASWGDLHLVTGPTTSNLYGNREFAEARGSIAYLFPTLENGALTLSASHHQTLAVTGTQPKLNVNRIALTASVDFR
jgi:hypothetical protein